MKKNTLRKKHVHVWLANIALGTAYFTSSVSGGLFLGSTQNLSNISAEPFNGAIYPIAFVPDWTKGDYVENRGSLSINQVGNRDLIALPDYDDIDSEFLSHFTYLTPHTGSYVDPDRRKGNGSHVGVDIRAPIDTPIFSIANGVVVETKISSGGTHVVVRHDDVKYNGAIEDYYSGYLHMKDVDVSVGQKVSKGEQVGTVGLTGITTTPHLHFQIDREDAPFHPYWPFTYKEARAAGYDFFSAINAGFHVDRVLEYSVDPIDFIENAQSSGSIKTSSKPKTSPPITTTQPTIPTVQESKPEPKVSQEDREREREEEIQKREDERRQEIIDQAARAKAEAAAERKRIQEKQKEGQSNENTIITTSSNPKYERAINGDLFPDVPASNQNYTAIKYFVDKGVLSGYENGNFGPNNTLTRAEMLAIVLKALEIDNDGEVLYDIFKDIPRQHWVNPLVTAAVEKEIITTARSKFELNRPVSKAEFLAIMMVAADEQEYELYRKILDVSKDDWYASFAQANYIYQLFDDYDSKRFNPNYQVKRGEVAEAMYRYLKAKDRI